MESIQEIFTRFTIIIINELTSLEKNYIWGIGTKGPKESTEGLLDA